jgi:hypothetical protein
MIHTNKQIKRFKINHFIYGVLWVALTIFWVYHFTQVFSQVEEKIDFLEDVELPPIQD